MGFSYCYFYSAIAVFGLVGLAATGAEPGPSGESIAAAETAVKDAIEAEKKAEYEWNSLEMARSATREIARAERAKAATALAAAEAALQAREADPSRAKEADQRLVSLQSAAERLMAETRTANDRASELFPSELHLSSVMAAHRAAECQALQLKAAAAAACQSPDCEAPRRAVLESQALAAWENQLWAKVAIETARQLIEQASGAAGLVERVAALPVSPAVAEKCKAFAQDQRQVKAAAEALIAKKQQEFTAATPKIYTLRTAAIGGLAPLDPDQWDRGKARHLLVRAGFGGTPAEVDRLCKLGLYGAVDSLLEFHRQPVGAAGLEALPPAAADPLAAKLRNAFVQRQAAGGKGVNDNGQLAALRRAWLKRMVESPRPLQEKLTLFWHGLFAAQASVVQNSFAMYQQNELFRQHAAGNYGALLYGIVHDPAMLRYLDNNRNVKGQPNENLAREIMELFSMGVDQGYTEKDIIEAARSLTGYSYDNRSGSFRYLQGQHDDTSKTIFGKAGPWSGDDLVRLILDQPATGRFVARRMFEFFAYFEPEPATIEALAGILRENNYEVEPLLRNLLLSAEFYGDRARAAQIKCPVQMVAGLLRDLGVNKGTDYGLLDGSIREMGQDLFEPPDVKGWRYGREWINSQRLFVRYNTAARLARGGMVPGRSGVDFLTLIPAAQRGSPEAVVDYLAQAVLVRPLEAQQRKALVDFCCDLPPAAEWQQRPDEVRSRLAELLVLLVSLPEFQMT
jgi:hypothetical protein